ncbi:MAG TPA: hypothetical protein VGK10_15610 [Prolixibacteraceae bacterium]|jgi:hypothetical protein
MKKQILILLMALFVIGISKSYGQLTSRPINVTCLPNDALHPVPGTPYSYTVTVPDPAGGTSWDTKKYTWFVTQDKDFVIKDPTTPFLPILNLAAMEPGDNSSLLMNPTTATEYASPANGKATIELTWKSFAYVATKPVFVVINVAGSVTSGCSDISNLKVYEIVPAFAFTLDIENLTRAGALPSTLAYGANIDNCISTIQSASYDAVNKSVIYNFGADTMYYEVNAANWFDRWELSAKVGGISSTQTVKLDWAYAPATRPIDFKADITKAALPADSWHVITAATGTITSPFTSTDLVAPKNGTTAVDKDGESIVIRMVVKHGTVDEGIVDEPITLAVDGILYHAAAATPTVFDVKGAANEGDINIIAGADPVTEKCPWVDGYVNDIATQTIKARPNILDAISDTPAATDYLPIQP